jgi:uncharacterized protein (TIGR02246 family)
MMIRMLIAALALLLAVPAVAQTAPDARAAVEAGMKDSADGWNRGDVDRFLAIYSDDPGTSFTGSKAVERGKTNIRARYLVSYPEQVGGMRSAAPTVLSFTFEDFRMIGADHALLIARWKLVTYADEKSEQTGMTSLLFRHEAGGWKIVADHSS